MSAMIVSAKEEKGEQRCWKRKDRSFQLCHQDHSATSSFAAGIPAAGKPITNSKSGSEILRRIFKFATSIHIRYIREHFSFLSNMAPIHACI